jgi:N-methylhydantoinase B/oxoprolinase/acetone carboxylase alpha subunit
MNRANTESRAADSDIDSVLLAVLANRFDAIVREMTNTLFRTGRSAVLNTAKDFSCSIVTADNDLLASVEGLQIHVFGASLQTEWMARLQPELAEGDAFLHNDPYAGNTHTADHTILVPVFVEDEHVFTACAKAHQADCGNSQASTYMPFARDLYEEGGLNFPCVRLQKDYRDVDDIIRMCRRRIRIPEVWYGDYLAALGAARVGEQRLKQLVQKYGVDTIRAFVREWLDYSERLMIHAISQLPPARLVGHAVHDPLPGLPDGVPVKVEVSVDPEAAVIEVDLRDNMDCVPAGVNLSEACTVAGVIIGVFNCLDPEVPRNSGSFRRLRTQLRENCVVGIPRFPTSCSMATTNVVNRLINATQSAFAQLGDGRGLAEGGVSMGVGFSVVSGVDWRRGGAAYVNQLVIGNNGGPASPSCDGWITYGLPDCAASVYHDSVEIIERKYPIHIRSLRLLPDSGGAGRHRGGPASKIVFGPTRDPMTAYYFADGHVNPPQGVCGGHTGMSASAAMIGAQSSELPLPPIHGIELQSGEWIVGVECGGGGYGSPLDRDPELVRRDVLEGWVSLGQARDVYGVVFAGSVDDESLGVDQASTTRLRVTLASKGVM